MTKKTIQGQVKQTGDEFIGGMETMSDMLYKKENKIK